MNGVGNEILASVPLLHQVYAHPEVRGALISLLGGDYVMNGHRHLHVNAPGSRSQNWHQDGTNVRHHQVWCVLAMYYPHAVPPEQGPTIIMPGTHLRNAPTERLATYANIKGQVPLAVPAGTVAITHYDLWHAATRNLTGRYRYMLKFLFDRQSVPTEPSWNHEPETVAEVAQRRIRQHVGPVDHSSDHYKEWELRTEMWQWMLGRPVLGAAGRLQGHARVRSAPGLASLHEVGVEWYGVPACGARCRARIMLAAAILGVALHAVATDAHGELRFTDVSAEAGLTAARAPLPDGVPAMGGCGAVGDFNNDGWQDLLFLAGGGAPDALYLNNGDGTFSDHAQEAGLALAHRGSRRRGRRLRQRRLARPVRHQPGRGGSAGRARPPPALPQQWDRRRDRARRGRAHLLRK